jgi:glycosyltransferase involved in cell wall biosynthesis
MRYAWEGRDAYLDADLPRWKRRVLSGILDRLRSWDRATAANVTRFVAVSETVRRRIARCYGRDSVVIPPPVDTDFYTPVQTPRASFYLCVSALVPYKRIDQAVAVCTATRRPLVVIGQGPERRRLERLAGPTVRFLGWQPDAVIRDHLRRCRALLFPGEEDFGIVPVEALACGAPVIALGRGGAAETVDDRVGRLYREPTPNDLAAALAAWEAEGCPADHAAARRRAEAFATTRFQERMRNLVRAVLAHGVADQDLTPGPNRQPAIYPQPVTARPIPW